MDNPYKKHMSIIQMIEKGSRYEAYLLIDQNLIPDLNITDHQGTTPLITSIIKGYTNLIKLLINKGANVNQENHKKMTPLMYALFLGNFEVCALLIEHGANLNAKDKNENTPLIFAVMTNQLSLVHFFIQKGASIDHINADSRSAFDIATQHQLYAITYCLLGNMTLQKRNNLRLINFSHNNLIKNFTESLKINSQKVYDNLMPTRYIYPSSTFYLLPIELIQYIINLLGFIQDYGIWYEPRLEQDLKLTVDFIKHHKKCPAIIFSSVYPPNSPKEKISEYEINSKLSQLTISDPKPDSQPDSTLNLKNKKNS